MGPSRESEGQEMNRINLIEENPRREARKNTNKQNRNFRVESNAGHRVNASREKGSLLLLELKNCVTYQQVPHGGQDFALSFTFLKLVATNNPSK